MAKTTTRVDELTGRVAIPNVDPENLRYSKKPEEFSVSVETDRAIDGLVWSNDRGEFFATEQGCPHIPAVRLKRGQVPGRREGEECQTVECSIHKFRWSEIDGSLIWWDEDYEKPRDLVVWRVEEEGGVLYLLV